MQPEIKDASWAIFDTRGPEDPAGPGLAEIIDARHRALGQLGIGRTRPALK